MTIITKAKTEDIDAILEIWFQASLKAHDFIPTSYWENQLLPMRDVYLTLSRKLCP
ncbi:hypothetical protein RYU24_21730 [Acinetobacter variabilis]|nr:hypothetical protein RYU24_21730 [Acinetobacter variabilis]